MMYWDDGHGGAGWGLAMLVMMVAFWAVLAVLAFAVFRTGCHHLDNHDGTSARRILGERLARGEIDVEEYKSRLAVLRNVR